MPTSAAVERLTHHAPTLLIRGEGNRGRSRRSEVAGIAPARPTETMRFTRRNLLISPEVEIADESQVIQVVLEALRRSSGAADISRAIWSQAQTLRVKRMEPIWTARAKLMPLHLAQRAQERRP